MSGEYAVQISPEALKNLEAVFSFRIQDAPQSASRLIKDILDAMDDLDTMPQRYRRAGRAGKSGNPVHAMVVRPFIVYYRIDDAAKRVFILEVRHGARRQPRRFG